MDCGPADEALEKRTTRNRSRLVHQPPRWYARQEARNGGDESRIEGRDEEAGSRIGFACEKLCALPDEQSTPPHVAFELDVDARAARSRPIEHFLERGNARAATQIDGGVVISTELFDETFVAPIRDAFERRIVDDHDIAVSVQSNVELDAVCALLHGELERLQRISRRAPARTSMPEYYWPSVAASPTAETSAGAPPARAHPVSSSAIRLAISRALVVSVDFS